MPKKSASPMLEEKSTASDESYDAGMTLPTSQERGVSYDNERGGRTNTSGLGGAEPSKKRCLYIGIGAACLFAVLLACVAAFVAKSFSENNSENAADTPFDFTDVGGGEPDFSFLNDILPSTTPTNTPTTAPVVAPVPATSMPTKRIYTSSPSYATPHPTGVPSSAPSSDPTRVQVPTISPAPVTRAPTTPVVYTSATLMQFCVIADVPYFQREANALPLQISTQMEGCEFVVHLGDIMKGEVSCTDDRYSSVRDILLESPIPAFIVPGDNEWNDCGDQVAIDEAWGRWEQNFMQLENNWTHTLNVTRFDKYPESFSFIHKRTLIFGLNIVGGRVHDLTEWTTRLTLQADWVQRVSQANIPLNADGVIIMAHARPTFDHRNFFEPMVNMVKNVLLNEVPVLYLHGDGHAWIYVDGDIVEQANYLRIQHTGGVRDPVLRILADPHLLGPAAHDAFQPDRQLHLQRN